MKFLINRVAIMAVLVSLICSPAVTKAHFIWVAKSEQDGLVKIYFGEGAQPDQAMFLGALKDMEVWSLDSNGTAKKIKYVKKVDGEDGWFECQSSEKFAGVDANCEYGVFGRGDTTMFLHYCAKYVELGPELKTKVSGKLPIDIEVATKESATHFRVVHMGKPAANCELQIVDEKNETHDLRTDSDGKVAMKSVPKSRWMIRAKVTDTKKGEVDGKHFDEKRYYCTMVLGLPQTMKTSKEVDSTEPVQVESRLSYSTPFPELPVGITSFGGAVAGDFVYVFGGHCGDAHDYYRSGQNSKLYRLKLTAEDATWEEINDSRGLQGLAMVSHNDTLYRVGGFEARNKQGEKQDLHSVDEFSRFNLESKKWEALAPMPSPRSSLDAVVVGDKLFVVGGWKMEGSSGKTWSNDAFWIDLSDEDAKWQTIEVPFNRRALTVGFEQDKLYVVGGMRKVGGPTGEVKVYDIGQGKWSDGPKLPGESKMRGFGCSCFNVGGRLVVSTYEGHVLKLNADKTDWEVLHILETGRFFHRLLPVNQKKFVLVGGANMSVGKMYDLPVFEF